jgi:hypothetical protein
MGGGEEVDEEEVTDDSGTGFDDVAPAEGVHGHEGLPGAAHNGAAAAVARVAADVARPRGRGPGRSRTLPASAAGVVGFSCPCPHSPAGVAGVPAALRGSQPIWAVTKKSHNLLIAQSLLTESSKISCPESCFFFLPIRSSSVSYVRALYTGASQYIANRSDSRWFVVGF